ncbi:acetyl esterase [Gimesia panareensis]|uniref:Acetyl esterase n=1 Tax=Gimesia panareensis TaxID=2527978 RepID=A0A517QEJ8_9PLAN|nr:alpha/beta hydrolase [Gimesia panareensis]QDT30051.1 acetyl esterase [Gimesia panareensis]
MPTFVSRVFSVIVLLAIVCYLIPDMEEQQKKQDPPRRFTSIYQSNIVSLPRDLKIIDDFPYQKGKNSRWRMDLTLPLEASSQPRPALIFVYAGGWSGGNSTSSYTKAGPLHYARKGYVCVSLFHRLSDDTSFDDCLEDLKCAIRWMRAHADKYQIDPRRIGAFGNANGGSLVCLVGLMGQEQQVEPGRDWQDQSSELNAICISAAPTDYQSWPDGIEHLPRMIQLAWNNRAELEEKVARVSPINYVRADAPPMLVMHGVLDPSVDVSQSDHFVEALKAAGAKDVTYFRSEDSGHAVFLRDRTQTFPMMEEFFARTLGYPQGIKVAQR